MHYHFYDEEKERIKVLTSYCPFFFKKIWIVRNVQNDKKKEKNI